MLISHKYRFIFLKTNKTAGTSLEIAMSKYMGSGDVITPISVEDEKLRASQCYRGPQNYLEPFYQYSIGDIKRWLLERERKMRFYHHMPACEIKRKIGEKIWNNYFSFCFERNPWDRVISLYYYDYKTEPRPTLREYLHSGATNILKKRGINSYTINGRIAVDRVCLFENLEDEIEKIRLQLGMPEKIKLPHAKTGFRKDRRHYSEILTNEEAAMIADLFSDEIRYFNYKY